MTGRVVLLIAALTIPGCIAWRSDAIGTAGNRELPPFTLSDDERTQLIAFLRTLTGGAAPLPSWLPSQRSAKTR